MNLETMTVAELRELKQEIQTLIKGKVDEEKEEKAEAKKLRAQEAKDALNEGDVVLFEYKGEECEGEVTKLNEKTFTVAFEYEGEGKVLARAYHLFTSRVSEKVA